MGESSMATPMVHTPRKKMTKQLTGKRDDTPLHSAARAGNLDVVRDILNDAQEDYWLGRTKMEKQLFMLLLSMVILMSLGE
jgi:hypothetical protein